MSTPVTSPTASLGVLRTLSVLSILELVSISGLFVNLFTVHLRPISTILGPTHGALYLCVAAIALLARGLMPRTRAMALIPLIGGVLTLLNVRTERRRIAMDPRSLPMQTNGAQPK